MTMLPAGRREGSQREPQPSFIELAERARRRAPRLLTANPPHFNLLEIPVVRRDEPGLALRFDRDTAGHR
jgi:hypothetical protein